MLLQEFISKTNCIICDSPISTIFHSKRAKQSLNSEEMQFTYPITFKNYKREYSVSYNFSLMSNLITLSFYKDNLLLQEPTKPILTKFQNYSNNNPYYLFYRECVNTCYFAYSNKLKVNLGNLSYDLSFHKEIITINQDNKKLSLSLDYNSSTSTLFSSLDSESVECLMLDHVLTYKSKQDLLYKIEQISIFK